MESGSLSRAEKMRGRGELAFGGETVVALVLTHRAQALGSPAVSSAADFSFLSRRSLLKVSLGAGALLVMGGGGLAALRGRAARVPGLACLSDHEYRTLAALAQALFPRGGAFELGADDLDMARGFDTFLHDEPAWNQGDLKRALFLMEIGPVIFEGRLRTFSNLTPDERVAHFEAWTLSDMQLRRQVALAFRRFLSLAFYDQPKVWEHIGYEGPLVNLPAQA